MKHTMFVRDMVKEHGLKRFFTLTLDPARVVGDPVDYINNVWKKFITVLRRDYPGVKFYKVLEAHGSGMPHLHGFWNIFVWQQELSDRWFKVGGGGVVWVEAIKGNAEKYVCKYLGKTLTDMDVSEGKRIWSRSEGTKTKKEGTVSATDYQLVREEVYQEDGKIDVEKCQNVRYNSFDVTLREALADMVEKEKEREEKQQGSDMEGAFEEVSIRCSEKGCQNMEAKEPENEHAEDKETPGAESKDKPGD